MDQTPVQYVMAQADVRVARAGHRYGVHGQLRRAVAAVTGITKDDGWWRVVCPDGTTGNCLPVSALPSLTQQASAPGSSAGAVDAAGALAHTLIGTVQGVSRKEYLLRTPQAMDVQVLAVGEVNFALEGVTDGRARTREMGDARWTGVLPLVRTTASGSARPWMRVGAPR